MIFSAVSTDTLSRNKEQFGFDLFELCVEEALVTDTDKAM